MTSRLVSDVTKWVIFFGLGVVHLGGNFEEHMIGQVIGVGIEVFTRIFGGDNNPGGSIGRCNGQEDLAVMFILGCLIRGFLWVFRAECDHSSGLSPEPFIGQKDAHMLTVDNPVASIDPEFCVCSPHPVLRFEVTYLLCGTESATRYHNRQKCGVASNVSHTEISYHSSTEFKITVVNRPCTAASRERPFCETTADTLELHPDFSLCPSPAFRVQRECLTQFELLFADFREHCRMGAMQQDLRNPAPHLLHLGLLHATPGHGRSANANAAPLTRRASVERNVIF